MNTLPQIQHIEQLFKTNSKFTDKEGKLFVPKILESIDKIDVDLVKLLMADEKTKEQFFIKIDDVYVLNQNDLIEFFTMNEYFNHSFTSYTNKIGLIKKDNFIKKFDDVVLAFPYKDCVLEGGQTKDDDKKSEVFYNSIISRDEIDRLLEPKVLTNIKRFDKDGEHEVDEITEDDNLIIKGNNLLALHSLKKRYAGKVKLIYIDPPYNTGNDSFGYNDSFNHSTWLTFMKNRLEVAREFLRDDGFIFISCDDNEQSYLKVLVDEVFGRDNFRNNLLSRRYDKNINNQFVEKGLKTLNYSVDYTLVFSKKDTAILNPVYRNLESEKRSNSGYWKGFWNDADRPTMRYDILGYVPFNGQWKWKKETAINAIKNYEKYLQEFKEYETLEEYWQRTGKKLKFIKRNLKGKGKNKGVEHWIPPSDKTLRNSNWTDIMSSETIGFDFSSPKSEKLIQNFIELATIKNDLVLDFHIGSGTTCAVAHKMGRRYIGIEQMDYIEDIAVERMKNVIGGEQRGISKVLKWEGGGNFIYAELKEIDNFTDSPIGKLNKNMQYLPISELEDEDYGISSKEIAINKKFYGVDDV